MRNRILLLFLLFIALSFKAFPAVIVVTSNADSGPGTLLQPIPPSKNNVNVQVVIRCWQMIFESRYYSKPLYGTYKGRS